MSNAVAERPAVKTPWIKNLGDVPAHLTYERRSMYRAVEEIAEKYPNHTAYIFMGKKTTYRALIQEIHVCARAFKSIGIRPATR